MKVREGRGGGGNKSRGGGIRKTGPGMQGTISFGGNKDQPNAAERASLQSLEKEGGEEEKKGRDKKVEKEMHRGSSPSPPQGESV